MSPRNGFLVIWSHWA